MSEKTWDSPNPCDLESVNALARQWADSHETITPVAIDELHIADDVLDAMVEGVSRRAAGGTALLVMDHTPMTRAGQSLKPRLTDMFARRLSLDVRTLPNDPSLAFHPTLPWCERLAEELHEIACVVALGSGSICDVAKYARHLHEQASGRVLPFVCIPTAASVTAYTSALSVITVDGAKRTLPSRPPEAIYADLPTLAEAPTAMTAAGFADVLARSVAYGDWFLAHQLGMDDYFSLVPTRVLEPAETRMIALAEQVHRRELDGIRALTEALMLAGMSMSLVNQTAPISGWEHVISHHLDTTADRDGRDHALHGAQVAVGTQAAARAYEQLLPQLDRGMLVRDLSDRELRSMHERIQNVYGSCDPSGKLVEEIWREVRLKLDRWQANGFRRRHLSDRLNSRELRDELFTHIRSRKEIEQALRAVNAPLTFDRLDPPVSDTTAAEALHHSHLIRERFTLGDLLDRGGCLTGQSVNALMSHPG